MTMLERAVDENTEMATDEKKVFPKKIGINNSLAGYWVMMKCENSMSFGNDATQPGAYHVDGIQ